MDIENFIAVACYKPIPQIYRPPYFPLCNTYNGTEPKGFKYYDNSGLNISNKNSKYAELSAQYWLWKNSSAEIKGLIHYRRFLLNESVRSKNYYVPINQSDFDSSLMLNNEQLSRILSSYKIIVAHAEPVAELGFDNGLEQFTNSHPIFLLHVIDEILLSSGQKIKLSSYLLKKKEVSYFNMFISKKSTFDAYSDWLFSVLNAAEPLIGDLKGYQTRWAGFLGERLLNYWVEVVEKLDTSEIYRAKVGLILDSDASFVYKKIRSNKLIRKLVRFLPIKLMRAIARKVN